jgi:hypothetical protein
MRSEKMNAVYELACSLSAAEQVYSFGDLAAWLNERGITTDYGTPYHDHGSRGVARLVSAAYAFAESEGRNPQPIADAFVNAWGGKAYLC